MSPVLASPLSPSKTCHPEAAESPAKASDSQRGISVLRRDADNSPIVRLRTLAALGLLHAVCEQTQQGDVFDRTLLCPLGK
jgi:hypothetical protein